jgi:hypothetical protein
LSEKSDVETTTDLGSDWDNSAGERRLAELDAERRTLEVAA